MKKFGKTMLPGMMVVMTAILSACFTPQAPYAADDSFITLIDHSKMLNLIENDNLFYSDAKTEIIDSPLHGTLELVADDQGIYLYTPHENYFGTDEFTYGLYNEYGLSIASVSMIIKETNIGPNVIGETLNEELGQFITVDLSLNDTDADGDLLTYKLISNPNLRGNLEGAIFTYTPMATSQGIQMVEYEVSDGIETRTATIIIHLLNRPIVVDDQMTMFLNEPINFNPVVNDILPGGIPLDQVEFSAVYSSIGYFNNLADPDSYDVSFDGEFVTFSASVEGNYYITYTLINEEGLESRKTGIITFVVEQRDSSFWESLFSPSTEINYSVLTSLGILLFFIGALILAIIYDHKGGSIAKRKK